MKKSVSELEAHLHMAADAALKKTVDSLFGDFERAANLAFPSGWPMGTEVRLGSEGHTVAYRLEIAMGRYREAMIKRLTPAAREGAIKAFIEKVDEIGDQVEDLKNQINYQ